MAAARPVQGLQEEATCPICLEYYTDPVTTKCGHNFWRSCISVCSERSGTSLPCPQCRELCPQGDLRANRQLQSMVQIVKQLSVQQERPPGEGLCEKHEEKLKLFCEEDEKLICVICQVSNEHEQHKVRPMKEAAQKYKKELQDCLKPLTKQLGALQQCQLREEKVSGTLRDIRSTLSRSRRQLRSCVTEEPVQDSPKTASIQHDPQHRNNEDVRLSQCKHEMMDPTLEQIKQRYKELLTLDEDTAHGELALSEEGRRVRGTDSDQRRPSNPKRFTDSLSVLGKEGFSSGRHYWELQLLEEGWWAVGVTRESVSRKGGVTHSPEGGVWAVEGVDGQYLAVTSPPSPLSPRQRPLKLGLYLDYEGGRLSVYNADTLEELFTFTGANFTGRVCPYFWLWRWTDLRLV